MVTTDDVHMADRAAKKPSPSDGFSDLLQTPYSDAFAFSDEEQRALDLYDKLRELELERSLIEAVNHTNRHEVSAPPDDDLQDQLITAEREALEAKAKFEIRNRISHNVLIMDPVLKAVHGGQQHTTEKRMLPLITENDTTNMLQGLLASELSSTTSALGTAERANIDLIKGNRELSEAVLRLAEKVKAQSVDDLDDPLLRGQVQKVEKDLKDSRKRAKTLKGILSTMIVGSGINWAADEELRDLVMDDEEDG